MLIMTTTMNHLHVRSILAYQGRKVTLKNSDFLFLDPGVVRQNERQIYRCNSLPLRRTSIDQYFSSNRFSSHMPDLPMNLTRHCPAAGKFHNAIELEPRIWISNDRVSLVCHTGSLPEEFLRIIPLPEKELNSIIAYESIPMLNEASSKISMPKKSTTVMNWPTFRVLKKPKVRSKILENVLERIEAGETIKSKEKSCCMMFTVDFLLSSNGSRRIDHR